MKDNHTASIQRFPMNAQSSVKLAPKPKRTYNVQPKQTPGPVGQARIALKSENRLATFIGLLLGGVIPVASFSVAHYAIDLNSNIFVQPTSYFVLGGLCFSAPTVFSWLRACFSGSILKSLGWIILIEGIMVYPLPEMLRPLAWTSLFFLVAINSVATGCNLSAKK